MRILFINQWFDPEPGISRGLPLARSLMRSGDQVNVLTGFPNYPGGHIYPGYKIRCRHREVIDGVPVRRVPLYPSHNNSAVRRALNYLSFALSASIFGAVEGRRADVAYVYHGGTAVGLPAVLNQARWRVPFVLHIADLWPESVIESGMIPGKLTRRVVEKVLSAWGLFVYRRAAVITVLSPGFKRWLVNRGVDERKIEVIYNWTEEDVFQPGPRDDELVHDLGLEGAFTVVYAGNIGAYQGIDTILKSASLLRDFPEIRFLIVGTGQKEAEMRKMAGEMRLENVQFLGQQEYRNMPRFYPLADVLLIHLNDHDFFSTTIPGKTQVSLACGRPILMAVRGDAADVVRQADAGITCEPGNPQAMADGILALYRLPKTRLEEMGRKGRDYYLREMSLDRATIRMHEIFQFAACRLHQTSALCSKA